MDTEGPTIRFLIGYWTFKKEEMPTLLKWDKYISSLHQWERFATHGRKIIIGKVVVCQTAPNNLASRPQNGRVIDRSWSLVITPCWPHACISISCTEILYCACASYNTRESARVCKAQTHRGKTKAQAVRALAPSATPWLIILGWSTSRVDLCVSLLLPKAMWRFLCPFP